MSSLKVSPSDRFDIGFNLSIEERRAQFVQLITDWAANRRREDALTRQELANLDSAQRLVAQKHALLDNFAYVYRKNPRADVAPGCLLFVTLFSDNNRGRCEYSMDRIARFFSRSPRAIQDAMKRLENQGLISREPRGRGYIYWPVVNRAFAIDRAHHGWLVDAMAPAAYRKSSSGVASKYRKTSAKTPEVERHHSSLRDLPKDKQQNCPSREIITTQEIEVSDKAEPAFLRKSALPETLELSPDGLNYAVNLGMTEMEARDAFEEFCDHHIAKGNQMVDWQRAWKQWVRNAFSYGHIQRKRAAKENEPAKYQEAISGPTGVIKRAFNMDAVITELVANHGRRKVAVQWLRPLLSMPGNNSDLISWCLMMIGATEGLPLDELDWAAKEAAKNCKWRPAPTILRNAIQWKTGKVTREFPTIFNWETGKAKRIYGN